MDLIPVLIWDIDGTILTTGGRGFPSMVRAVQEVIGFANQSHNYSSTHGLTDIEVIRNILGEKSDTISNNEIKSILELYEKCIEEIFNLNPPIILPNIMEVLTLLTSISGIKTAIGTGNSFNGARVKLKTSKVLHFFSESNFHCANIYNSKRIDVIQSAKNDLKLNEYGIVVGDTPADIQCARLSGLNCIAIASGSYSFEELKKHNPDKVLSSFWTNHDFMSAIEQIQKVNIIEIKNR